VKTFEIKLDVEKSLYSPMQILFNVSNQDVGIDLSFEFTQDDAIFDLTGKTLELVIQKPSRKVIHHTIEIDDATGGKASATLPQNSYEEYGIHSAEVHIIDLDSTIVTNPFHFNTWESFVQTTEEPTDGTTGTVYWTDVLNKPTSFPPSSHAHPIADVTGLQDALDSKADVGTGGGTLEPHTHAIADVTNLQTELDEKASTIHTHGIADVTGLQNALDGKVDDAEMTNKADLNHTHGIADVNGLQTALDGKANTTDLATKMDDGDAYLKSETYNKTELYNKTEIDQMTMGDGGGSPVIVEDNLTSTSTTNALSSNQGRILDETKADAIHTHDIADVSGLSGELDLKADVNHNHDTTYAPIVHTHAIGDVTNLQTSLNAKADATALDGKADTIHGHVIGDVDGLQLALDSKVDDTEMAGKSDVGHTHDYSEITNTPASMPPDAHTHAIADVTNLQTTLDSKVDDTEMAGKSDVGHTHDYTTDITGKPTSFPPDAHSHTKAEITDFAHTHLWADVTDKPTTFTPTLMATNVVGGGRVGNGLRMVGEYLTIREGAGIKANPTTYALDVDRAQTDAWYVQNATGQNLTMWKGTQLEYDAITTPDANTLYFIVG
jgi:hypothetical protein